MGSDVSIDVSVSSLWAAWQAFQRGKRKSLYLDMFAFNLEDHLFALHRDFVTDRYVHGAYQYFRAVDTKTRLISVATVRDRLVHRLVYDFLVSVFDPVFLFDAWSCRKGKGLIGAILRAQQLLQRYHSGYFWRWDIVKCFDHVDHRTLQRLIERRVGDTRARSIIGMIIGSFFSEVPGKAIPIGNLTSQIFVNIYLHELDRYLAHEVRPLGWVRYGDDVVVIGKDYRTVSFWREQITGFLEAKLLLQVHPTQNIIKAVRQGIHFLGCDMFPTRRTLRRRMQKRMIQKLNFTNIASYRALVLHHGKQKDIAQFDWRCMEMIENFYG